jgi:cell division protein FtsB
LKKEVSSFRVRIKSWQIPWILLNKYYFTLFVFVTWMTFFDRNNLFVQMGRLSDLHAAVSQTRFYVDETEKTRQQLTELKNNQKALEEFAREKYYMKKKDEDVFVFIDK